MNKLPELLSPAGSLQAFEAAIDGGADAIYVGGASFNARINAKNFSADELRQAVRLAHAYGVKVYQTINIIDTSRSNIIIDKIKKTKYNKGYKINTIKRSALWIGERSLNSLKIAKNFLTM